MPDIAWDLPVPVSGGFRLENLSRSGGVALNGFEQNIFSLSMRWRARWTVQIRTREEILAARAMFAKLMGKAQVILVPFFDGKRVSWPVDRWGRTLNPKRTRRRELDGTIYQDPAIPTESEIVSVVVNEAAARSVTIDVEVTQGGPPLPGQHFGIDDRGYIIRDVHHLSSDLYNLEFFPPLRAVAGIGDGVKFTDPVCAMNQVSDDQGILELDTLRFTTLSLEFVEAF